MLVACTLSPRSHRETSVESARQNQPQLEISWKIVGHWMSIFQEVPLTLSCGLWYSIVYPGFCGLFPKDADFYQFYCCHRVVWLDCSIFVRAAKAQFEWREKWIGRVLITVAEVLFYLIEIMFTAVTVTVRQDMQSANPTLSPLLASFSQSKATSISGHRSVKASGYLNLRSH